MEDRWIMAAAIVGLFFLNAYITHKEEQDELKRRHEREAPKDV
jgi:hypothetical protein